MLGHGICIPGCMINAEPEIHDGTAPHSKNKTAAR